MSSQSTDNEMQRSREDAYADLLRPKLWNWEDDDDEVYALPNSTESTQGHEEGGKKMTSATDLEDDGLLGEAEGDHTIQDTIDHVFAWRSFSAGRDSAIHHFNWLGQPVWQRSTMAPADSLVFIQGRLKTAWSRENYRVQSILNRAIQFVDPVVVILDNGDTSFLNLKGTALAHAAVGRVFKIYSPHGQWMIDDGENTEEVILDHGESAFHGSDNLAIGSGFITHSSIRTPSDWFKEAAENAELEAGASRKLRWKASPSSLGPNSAPSPETPTAHPRAFGASLGSVQSYLCDGAPFDFHDDAPARLIVRLPTTITNTALDDQPSRASTFLVDGTSGAAANRLSNHVPEGLSEGVCDNLFGTAHDIVSEETPGGTPHIPSDGYSDRLFDSENSSYHTNGPIKSPYLPSSSSSSITKPSKGAFVDLCGHLRTMNRHNPEKPAAYSLPPKPDRGNGERRCGRKALSKTWKSFKSAFGSRHIHLELFI